MTSHLSVLGATILTTAIATAVVAETVSASDPQSVLSAVEAFGHPALLTPDAVGDPSVDAEIDGEMYSIFFHGCQNNTNCRDLEIWVVLLPDNQPPKAKIDAWNTKYPRWTAYLDDEGDPNLERYFSDVRGMSRSDFNKIMSAWDARMTEFMQIMGR